MGKILTKLTAALVAMVGLGAYPSGISLNNQQALKRKSASLSKKDRTAIAKAEQKRLERKKRLEDLERRNPKIPHWNSAGKLPLVDAPLYIKTITDDGQEEILKAHREEWVSPANKENNLKFTLESGTVIEGRFPWTYQ